MTLEVFVTQMRVLESKYGRDKINPKLVNEVWRNIKHLDDEYIVSRVSILMTTKSVYADKFILPDFIALETSQDSDEPVEEQNSVAEDKKPKKKVWMNHAEYTPKKKEKDPQALPNYLKKVGATSALDAMNKILAKKKNQSK
jgi:hypothetical protein